MSTATTSPEVLARASLFGVDREPASRDLILIAVATLIVRLIYITVICQLRHLPLQEFVEFGDAGQYVSYTRMLLGEPVDMPEYQLRLFPGVPALTALVHVVTRTPIWVSGLILCLSCAMIASVGSAILFKSRIVGIGMIFLIPDYLLVSSLLATEAPMLAFTVIGLIFVRKGWSLPAGLALGIAGVCRPMACFAVMGILFLQLIRKRWKPALIIALASLAMIALAMLWQRYRFGDPIKGARVYATSQEAWQGELFSWPMKWIILTPLRMHVAPFKIVLVWVHIIACWIACVVVTTRAVKRREDLDLIAAPWLIGNTLFIMCVGTIWGFLALPRYVAPALPAMLWGLRRILPSSWLIWFPLGAASFATAVVMFLRR